MSSLHLLLQFFFLNSNATESAESYGGEVAMMVPDIDAEEMTSSGHHAASSVLIFFYKLSAAARPIKFGSCLP